MLFMKLLLQKDFSINSIQSTAYNRCMQGVHFAPFTYFIKHYSISLLKIVIILKNIKIHIYTLKLKDTMSIFFKLTFHAYSYMICVLLFCIMKALFPLPTVEKFSKS